MSDAECPYCHQYVEINHDDGYGYEEDKAYEQECSECEKTFTYYTSISFSYSTRKAPCLNGKDHYWKPTKTHPRCFTAMECVWCEKRRAPTDQEWFNLMEPMEVISGWSHYRVRK